MSQVEEDRAAGPKTAVAAHGDSDGVARVQEVVENIERDVLDAIAPVSKYFGAPGFVFLAVFAIATHTFSPWMGFEGLGIAVTLTAVSARRARHQTRTALFCTGITCTGAFGIFHFGPLIGTGLLFCGATLASAFFHGKRGAYATYVALMVAFVVCAVATQLGWVEPLHGGTDPLAWIRMGITTSATLGGVMILLLRVKDSFRRSVTAEVAARAAERAAEAQRERVLRVASETQRLESLGRLAGGVAHDFNNALVVIQSGVELLRQGPGDRERSELLEEVDQSVTRAVATSKQLLAFTRRNVDEIGDCDPSKVVPSLVQSLGRMLPANIVLNVETQPTPPVSLSAPGLEQALLNLLINARDAMPDGGEISLSCRFDEAKSRVEIVIRDTGIGMSADVREHIFEPFFTTKGDRGTGLGLAMVWATVHRHGGEIQVASEVGRGTSFTILLPATARIAASPAQSSEEVAPVPAPKATLKILVIEDEDAVRRIITRILTAAGYEVFTVASAAEARQALQDRMFSILLTDGILPDGGAADVIRAFRERHTTAPVVVCSGYFEEELTIDEITRGEYRFLRKPFLPDELRAVVKDVASRAQASF